MDGNKNGVVQIFIERLKAALGAFCIMGMMIGFMSCADLQEEFDASQWRYQPAPDMPPSWENDMGRPPLGGEGETPFS